MSLRLIIVMLLFAAAILALIGYLFNSPKCNSVAIIIVSIATILAIAERGL